MEHPSDLNVDIYVVDNRRDGKTVSYKKGDHNVERASIKLAGNLSEEITHAVALELKNRGFNIEKGSTQIQIDIQKFYNEFKEAFFGSRGIAELILSVTVTKKTGNIYYSKMIIGIGENESVWLHSGNNAAKALSFALSDAIHKLFTDPAFLQALTRDLAQKK
jgi:uncharacterized lipoprotein YajG